MTDRPLAGRLILIVEDEMLILMKTEDMLTDHGCRSMSAGNVEQALELILAERFDAAMLDVNLNGEKSYPVADALTAGGVPFLFSTGYSGESLKDGYRDQPVLGKPYCDSELVTMLSSLLSPAGTVARMPADC